VKISAYYEKSLKPVKDFTVLVLVRKDSVSFDTLGVYHGVDSEIIFPPQETKRISFTVQKDGFKIVDGLQIFGLAGFDKQEIAFYLSRIKKK
jgi:hypothetical protein